MLRVRISNFIRKNKDKINDLVVKLTIVAIVVLIATIVLSFSRNNRQNEKNNENKEVYKPQETVVKGRDVPEKQYTADTNAINQFLEYCNNKEFEKAYELISTDCKEELYPSLELFKTNYCANIFKEKREYNLQSWVSTNQYTIYKIRYTTNLLATGKYDENNVYQDYITLIKENNNEKIAIGTFILKQELSKETDTQEIQAKVINKNIYVEDEEYELYVKNKTENIIKLDSLKKTDNIKIIGDSGGAYDVYTNKIFSSNITIQPGETKRITLRFKKSIGSDNISKYIQFSEVIRNYTEYMKDEDNYLDLFNLKIQL